jgi:hypothetical protein
MLREIWGDDADVQYLRVYVRSLRQKIETDPERPSHILTETGRISAARTGLTPTHPFRQKIH